MFRVIAFALANAAMKVTPLLQSAVIISLSGAAYFSEIAFYFVAASLLSSLFTAGVVPGYTRSIGEREVSDFSEGRPTPANYVQAVIFGVLISICVVLILNEFGALGGLNPFAAGAFGIAVGVTSILIPILLLLRKNSFVLVAVVFFLLGSISVAVLSSWMSVENFQYFFCAPPLIMTIVLAYYFSRVEIAHKKLKVFPIRPSDILLAYRDIAPIFIPNVFWMAMLFWFANRINEGQSDPAVLAWYVTGLQMFGFVNFIPNSISPLILLRLTSKNSSEGFWDVMKLASVIFLVAAFLLGAASLTLLYTLPDVISGRQGAIWLPMLIAACFVSTFAPLNAYLVKQRRAFLILPGAICWTIIAHAWLSFDMENFPLAFLIAYVASWCVLVFSVWVAHGNKPEVRA